MKKIGLILTLMILASGFVLAQVVPVEYDTTTINKIDQEHKNTRKFFSDELTRQRAEFFNQMDDRFDYYERTADSFITTAVWKLGLIWGSVTLFVFGISNLLRIKLEQKRFQKLKQGIINDVKSSLPRQPLYEHIGSESKQESPKMTGNLNMPVFQQKTQEYINQPQAKIKKSFFQRRKEKKMQDELSKLKIKEAQLMQKLGFHSNNSNNNMLEKNKTENQKASPEYQYTFEVGQ